MLLIEVRGPWIMSFTRTFIGASLCALISTNYRNPTPPCDRRRMLIYEARFDRDAPVCFRADYSLTAYASGQSAPSRLSGQRRYCLHSSPVILRATTPQIRFCQTFISVSDRKLTSHRITVPSPLPEARFLLSGLKARLYTLPVWPLSGWPICCCPMTSHSKI